MQITIIACGECGGTYVQMLGGGFRCASCGHAVNTSDIEPNLDEGETLVLILGHISQ